MRNYSHESFKQQTMIDCIKRFLSSFPFDLKWPNKFRCSKLAAVCMISDAVCMFIYLFMMNYFPTNMTNLIYLIDSKINLISLIMIQKSWRIVIFPWKREKLNYRMSDRSFCQYDGSLGVIRGEMNRSTRAIWLLLSVFIEYIFPHSAPSGENLS